MKKVVFCLLSFLCFKSLLLTLVAVNVPARLKSRKDRKNN